VVLGQCPRPVGIVTPVGRRQGGEEPSPVGVVDAGQGQQTLGAFENGPLLRRGVTAGDDQTDPFVRTAEDLEVFGGDLIDDGQFQPGFPDAVERFSPLGIGIEKSAERASDRRLPENVDQTVRRRRVTGEIPFDTGQAMTEFPDLVTEGLGVLFRGLSFFTGLGSFGDQAGSILFQRRRRFQGLPGPSGGLGVTVGNLRSSFLQTRRLLFQLSPSVGQPVLFPFHFAEPVATGRQGRDRSQEVLTPPGGVGFLGFQRLPDLLFFGSGFFKPLPCPFESPPAGLSSGRSLLEAGQEFPAGFLGSGDVLRVPFDRTSEGFQQIRRPLEEGFEALFRGVESGDFGTGLVQQSPLLFEFLAGRQQIGLGAGEVGSGGRDVVLTQGPSLLWYRSACRA